MDNRGAKASVQARSSSIRELCSVRMSGDERVDLVFSRGILPSIQGIGCGTELSAQGIGVCGGGAVTRACTLRGWMEWL